MFADLFLSGAAHDALNKDNDAGEEGDEANPLCGSSPVVKFDGKRGFRAAAGNGDDDDEGEDDANQALADNQPGRKEGTDAFGVFQTALQLPQECLDKRNLIQFRHSVERFLMVVDIVD